LLAEAENSMPCLIVQCIGTSPSSVCNLQVRLSVSNQTDRHIGPLQISMSQDDAQGVSRAIVVNGLWTMVSSSPFSVDGISVVWNDGIQGLK
jgi:hypothetical protein